MRRILIALVMSGAVVVAAPTVATAAHHHGRHHTRHHARHRSIRNGRRERFGHWDTSGSAQPAGTVSSFTDNGDGTGTLILMLNGNSVTGTVNNNTELDCTSPSSTQQGAGNDGDDNGGSNDSSDGGSSSNSGDDNGGSGDDNGGSGDDNGGSGDDNGDDNGAQMCSTANLTPGASVADAVLEFTSSGAVWNKIELITP